MKDQIVNKMFKKHLVDFSIIIFIFLIDRLSKLLIIGSPETYEQYGISITSFLNFNLIWNEGIAFGLFSFNEKLYYNFLTIFICLITVIIIWLMFRSSGFEKLSYIMIIGGSFGNIFDRVFYSAVPDFIDIHINNLLTRSIKKIKIIIEKSTKRFLNILFTIRSFTGCASDFPTYRTFFTCRFACFYNYLICVAILNFD